MKVLSLFDGLSAGRLALERAGIYVEEYYASEIDKYASTISKKNWPDIIPIGDVTQVSYKDGVLHTQFGSYQTDIDMVIGGSPCQSFSVAGNQEGIEGKSGLFYEWVRILREVNPKYFLLENVCMKKEWENEITQEVGVAPIMINSALVSAQNRKRLYWTNIEGITQPQDRGIILPDILECDTVQLKQLARGFNKGCIDRVVEKSPTLSISSWQHNNFFKCINTHETNKTVTKANKAYCLTANYNSAVAWNSIERKQRSMVVIGESDADGANIYGGKEYRKLTPIECERLQTLPDDYTKSVSNNQRYKMIGNGWTVDVIAHIFSFIKQEKQND
mgnify:CR=1 FL=1